MSNWGVFGVEICGPEVELMCWTEGVCVELRGTPSDTIVKIIFQWKNKRIFINKFKISIFYLIFSFSFSSGEVITEFFAEFSKSPFLKKSLEVARRSRRACF